LEKLVLDETLTGSGRKGLDWTYVARDRDTRRKQARGEDLIWIYVAQDKEK